MFQLMELSFILPVKSMFSLAQLYDRLKMSVGIPVPIPDKQPKRCLRCQKDVMFLTSKEWCIACMERMRLKMEVSS